MKPVNLYMLARRPKDVPASFVESILSARRSDVFMRDAELEDVAVLTEHLMKAGASIQAMAGFFCSYAIDHIGKEFDLLKIIARRMIINIEIKSQNKKPVEMEQQLKKNAYYLRGLGLPMQLYTWLKSENALYVLKNNELVQDSMEALAAELNHWSHFRFAEDLDALFLPELYLVSPMNNPRRFLQENYFLTAHQNAVKKELLEAGPSLWSVYGEAGTGKTLFLLDIARHLALKEPVLFLHSGQLQKGHYKIADGISNLEIRSTSNMGALAPFCHILVDDAQRLLDHKLHLILEHLSTKGGYGIFGYDPRQILTWKEQASCVCALLEKDERFYKRRFTRRIRSNASLAAFASCLFQTSRMLPGSVILNDLICLYADSPRQAQEICTYYQNNGFITISYCGCLPNASVQGLQDGEALLGQEYDKVLVAADERFIYENGFLISSIQDPVYIQENLLFQGLARTRRQLVLLCVNNPALFAYVLTLQQAARKNGPERAGNPLKTAL